MHTISVSSDQVFGALSDPTRLRIAVLLMGRELRVSDLTAVLRLPQSSVSRHMGALRATGVVTDRRDGRWVHYRLADPLPVASLRLCLYELTVESPYREDSAKLQEQSGQQE